MNDATSIALAAGLAYLIGGIPFGFLVARFVHGVDIRRAGSGNIGATNVGRVLGHRWGAFVLLLDAGKGAVPVLVLPALWLPADSPNAAHAAVVTAIAAVLGHVFPVWLGFRGGKGVATALGAVIVLSPWATLTAFVAFALVVAGTRIVSLGSLIAAATYAATEFVLLQPAPFSAEHWSRAVFAIAVPLLIAVRHRANVVRLWKGTEQRLGTGGRDEAPAAESSDSPS